MTPKPPTSTVPADALLPRVAAAATAVADAAWAAAAHSAIFARMVRGVSLLSLMLLCGCMKTSNGYIPAYCANNNPHFIASERQAILAARDVWNCIEWREKPSSEKSWLDHFGAVLRDRVWHVYPIVPEGYAGGGANISLREKDASLVDIEVTQ